MPRQNDDVENTYGLSPERVKMLRAQAREDFRRAEEKRLEDKFLAEERQRVHEENYPSPVYEKRDLMLDLAPHSDRITIDGREYHHGHTYTDIPKPRYDAMMEIIAAGWRHEREIGNANQSLYRTPMDMTLSGRTGFSGRSPQSSVARFH